MPASTARATSPPKERPEPRVTLSGPYQGHQPDTMPGKPQVRPAAASASTAMAAFLTRPYWNPHTVTSVFDHCNPNYTQDGMICEDDGTIAYRSNGIAPDFASGYAITPRGTDYLYYDGHDGWDLALNYEPLLAAADGTVYFAGWSQYGFGLSVIIDHPNGLSTRYGHMSQIYVSAGQAVSRGQQIGISGNTGVSTGPHLHFGVYRNDPWTPIDPWGWTGSFADPWPSDLGNLWIGGNPQNPVPTAPFNVTATASGNAATVTWSAPTFDGGSPLTSYTVTSNPPDLQTTVGPNVTSATFTNIPYGRTYTFTVTAANPVGSGPASSPSGPVSSSLPAFTAWFPWYDNTSPGMGADNIHLVNPGTSDVHGYLVLGAVAVPITVLAGQATAAPFPPGSIGGPVEVMASGRLVATQRVTYLGSFDEVAASTAASAAATLWWPWYDHASPGMEADNVHMINPGTVNATATVSLPGWSTTVSVPAQGEAHVSFPQGAIGGPLKVVSDQPLLGAQRVEYGQSFNETPGRPASSAATTTWINWYDDFSPGMDADNVHVLNPGAQTVTVQVTIAGATSGTLTVPPGEQRWYTAPAPVIGGPVKVTASGPVLASNRVRYYDSFNEVAARSSADAVTTSYLAWYDTLNAGMNADTVHVLNPGSGTVTGKVMLGTSSLGFTIPPGGEQYVAFGPGNLGGPVTITSSAPVIATQRVEYYQSFNELLAAG